MPQSVRYHELQCIYLTTVKTSIYTPKKIGVSLQQSPAEFGLQWEGCWVSHWRFLAAECLSDLYSAVETEERELQIGT